MSDIKGNGDLTHLLSALEELDSLDATRLEEAKRSNERRKDLQVRLKARVLKGESTGDPVTDYIIDHYGHPDKDLAKAYRDLKNRVDACVGEPVLVTEARLEPAVHSCFGDSHDDRNILEQTWMLGMIEGPLALVPGMNHWRFPVESHARWSSRSRRQEASVTDGPPKPLMASFFPFTTEKRITSNWNGNVSVPELRFVIGWEELDAFGNAPEGDLEEAYARTRKMKLRHRTLSWDELEKVRSERLLVLFGALGIDIPEKMPKLRAYRERHPATLLARAEDAMKVRDDVIADIASGESMGRTERALLKEANAELRTLDKRFKACEITGDVPTRVADIVAMLPKKETVG